VDGNHLNRVFDINPNFDPQNPKPKFLVTLTGFTIQNGLAIDAANPDGANASGGGIRDNGNASLPLNNVVVANNTASSRRCTATTRAATAQRPRWTCGPRISTRRA